MDWQRPESITYPKVWHEFEGLHKINGQKPKFWIQDIPENMFDEVMEIMKTRFVNEEPLCKFAKLGEDLESLAEASAIYTHFLVNKLSCVCMTYDLNKAPVIAGVTVLARVSEQDPPYHPQTSTYLRLRNLTEYAFDYNNIYQHLGIKEYLCDRGIYVMPEYRKQGICFEILKCWKNIGTAVGFKAVAGTFTSTFSQSAAKRAGFSELSSFEYIKLGEVDPDFYLPGIEKHTKFFKILYTTF